VFGTNWYHKLKLPASTISFAATKRWKDADPVPGNVSYNGYMCTKN
jgi:hypothetical protein